jgi:WXG100 family type VII secretion target
MAGRIKLTPEDLRTSAAKYTSGSTSITDVLSTLTTEQGVIRENWEGSAFESFDAQFNELSPKIQQFAELLEQINQQLRSVAQIVERTDADIATQINTR